MGLASYLRQKQLHRWGPAWLRERASAAREPLQPGAHVLFAFCDHWEPLHEGVGDEHADRRVEAWAEGYPKLAERFVDDRGRHPRHSFFFPGEQYRARWLDRLAELCRGGYGEVELHLHHDGDDRESLRADIERYVTQIAQHGHFPRDEGGRPRYAFIHGNWCVANSRDDGRYCGVDDEIPLLFDTGCYADFTFPAPDSDAQPSHVNRVFWPVGELARRRAYEQAERARVGRSYDDRILFIEGPSALALRKAKLPLRIEASAVTAHDPGTRARVESWIDQRVSVEGRPEWVFVKVHTHGAPDAQAASLLGEGGASLHEALRAVTRERGLELHYVSAREMYNVAMAAMDGATGDPADHYDHRLPKPPAA